MQPPPAGSLGPEFFFNLEAAGSLGPEFFFNLEAAGSLEPEFFFNLEAAGSLGPEFSFNLQAAGGFGFQSCRRSRGSLRIRTGAGDLPVLHLNAAGAGHDVPATTAHRAQKIPPDARPHTS
ncbi:hypothetical protein [Sorangium sp. So ce1389]|uniref:hypothetical protein n=1 Tax=Sorangium sp. So ce1389 TaxID=3133336 RepID=UPI003F636D2B